jgi:hypothetical protein
MLNKKMLLLYSFVMLSISTALAQKPSDAKFYVKIFGGYGILTPGSFRLTSTSSTSYSVGNTGLGEGLHFGGGLGYIVNDFLNLGVDVEYLKGNDLKASSSNISFAGTESGNSKIPYSTLSIVPNITFKALSKPNYLIYTRIGILITASTKSSLVAYDSSDEITNTPHEIIARTNNTTYTYNVNVGVQAALGVQFRLTENLRGFVELVGNYLPITPASSTTNLKINYYDPGPTYFSTSTSTTNITYNKSGNAAMNQLPSTTFNVNYIGLDIGLAMRF